MKRLLLLALLAGCAAQPKLYWTKEGSTQALYDHDSAQCRMGLAGLPRSGIVDAPRDEQYMRDCMVTQGWTLKP